MDTLFNFFILIVAVFFLANGLRILREYERGVVFFLGRFYRVKGPGPIIIIPFLQQMVKVTKRMIVLDVPPQDIISKDNISVRVNAVVYFQVDKPELAINNVEDFYEATSQLAQTTLRSILGQHDLDEMLAEREKLNLNLKNIIDKESDKWGIRISSVELKDIDLSEGMIRAIARQAEAERERRAKIINAEGELQAAQTLKNAANILSEESGAMLLRYLQTMNDISSEKSSTIIFPLPIDLLKMLQFNVSNNGDQSNA
jgi:regulator of protease activity HflC (stomatin/prohibitin superfamily)